MAASLDRFPYREMEEPHLCGPTALAQVLEFLELGPPAGELERLWGFRRGSDRTDTPGHHIRVLRALGLPYAVRRGLSLDELAAAVSASDPVVALVATGRLLRHWVVVTGISDGSVTLAWGDRDGPVTLASGEFDQAFSGGVLDILMGTRRLGYCVGRPGGTLPWPSSRALELHFRLQRPVAEYAVIPVVETLLGGLRRARGAPPR